MLLNDTINIVFGLQMCMFLGDAQTLCTNHFNVSANSQMIVSNCVFDLHE